MSFNVSVSLNGISKSDIISSPESLDILVDTLADVIEYLNSNHILIATIIDDSSRRQLHNKTNIRLSSLSSRLVIVISVVAQKLGFQSSVTAYDSLKQRLVNINIKNANYLSLINILL